MISYVLRVLVIISYKWTSGTVMVSNYGKA